MSQIYKASTGGGVLPPSVPTTFTTQDGAAVPAANILIVNGAYSTQDNDNGIISKGGVAGTGTSNEVDIVITNRLFGSGTAINGADADLVTFSMAATPTVYRMFFDIAGRETTTNAGVGYSLFICVKSDGATATIVKTPFDDSDEDISLGAALCNAVVSGNNLIIRVTGVVGSTIVYKCVGTYVAV